MSKLHNSQMIFMLLILCMVSVWTAPMFFWTGMPAVEFTENDSDPFEFDDDLFLIDRDGGGMLRSINYRTGGIYLGGRPASLERAFPPPRPSYS
jgi:hypothetical protein